MSAETKTVAVIIKHPFRDFDWRVDMAEVPESASYEEIERWLYREMLGPFKVVAIASRVNLTPRKYKPPPDCNPLTDDHAALLRQREKSSGIPRE